MHRSDVNSQTLITEGGIENCTWLINYILKKAVGSVASYKLTYFKESIVIVAYDQVNHYFL